MASQTIYIIYSSSTSLWGQLAYGFRRRSAATAGTACAALELTHAGINANERPEWADVKKQIPLDLKQQHFDEIPEDLKHFIERKRYEFPCVVGKTVDGRFHMLFSDSELPDFFHWPAKFVQTLQARARQAGMTWNSPERAYTNSNAAFMTS